MPTEGGADAVLAWAVERFETHDERIVAEVMLEEESREGEVEAIEALFDEEGVPSVVTARIGRRSAGPLPWTLLIEAPIGVFLTTLAARAAGDAYEPLKRLVQRVFELRRRPDRPDGSIQLEENGRTVILTDKIPDEDSHRRLAPRMRPRGATRCGGEREPGAPPGSGRSRPATPRIRTRLAAQAQAQAKTQLSGSGPDLTPHLVVETVETRLWNRSRADWASSGAMPELYDERPPGGMTRTGKLRAILGKSEEFCAASRSSVSSLRPSRSVQEGAAVCLATALRGRRSSPVATISMSRPRSSSTARAARRKSSSLASARDAPEADLGG